MKEENKIPEKGGTENPFRIPGGYFENLTSEVMGRLPVKEKPAILRKKTAMWEKIRPWLYMAAMFIGAWLIIRIARTQGGYENDMEIKYINTVLDNSMLDDYSLYVYLADAEGESD